MAGLARGKLIYGDASGDPAALAVGAADEVLTHDGTDFDWAAAAGGGIVKQVQHDFGTTAATASTSYVDMAAANVSITTTGTSDLLCFFVGHAYNTLTTQSNYFAIQKDSDSEVGITEVDHTIATNRRACCVVHLFTGLGAATYSISGRWRVDGGTANNSGGQNSMTVYELTP
jgi:hypothetical protein